MISLSTVGLFSISAIILALTPGPDMLYIATRSISQGRSAGIYSALGVHTGVLIHTLAAAIGISAIIVASTQAYNVIRYAGAAYLVYLGIRTILNKSESLEIKVVENKRLRSVFYQGLITNLFNPNVILFFLAFLPQFVDPAKGSISIQLLTLGCIMVVVTLPIDIAIGIMSGSLGKFFKTSYRFQGTGRWLTSSVLISLGISTALFGGRKI